MGNEHDFTRIMLLVYFVEISKIFLKILNLKINDINIFFDKSF